MERSELEELLRHPAESLGVEFKRWLDPANELDSSSIARTLIAMRNFDGGILIMGLNDASGEPAECAPKNVREIYHPDILQGIVGRFARPPFEVEIHFIPRNDTLIPVIVVPGGVKAPVMARRAMREETGKVLLEQNAVYVRCLANNTVSSSKPVTHRDWEDLFAKCFANREVDVGQFIQRHIPSLIAAFPNLADLANTSQTDAAITQSELQQRQAFEFLEFGRRRYERRLAEQQAGNRTPQLPPHGAWEVAFTIADRELTFVASTDFLDRLFINQPRYTGWPCWIDSRSFHNELSHPYPFDRGWEAMIIRLAQDFFYNHIDFWRIEPRGRFYQRRALEDDINASRGNQMLPALKLLDFVLVIGRVAEAIGVGLQFVKGLGCDPAETLLNFAFRWTKLKSRQLASRAEPGRNLFPGSEAVQDEVRSLVQVPLDTEAAKIYPHVRDATRPVFEVFGKEFKDPVYEEICTKTLQRR